MPPCLSDPKGVPRRFPRDMLFAAFGVKIQMGSHNYSRVLSSVFGILNCDKLLKYVKNCISALFFYRVFEFKQL